jgi:propionate CoA-transferase
MLKKVVFVGTFTAGGLEIGVENGELQILKEGRFPKFLNSVEQITFSGKYASQLKQQVMYVTERAVFHLRENQMILTEIAPSAHLEKDILAHMDFKPIISQELKLMDSRIFSKDKIGLNKL